MATKVITEIFLNRNENLLASTNLSVYGLNRIINEQEMTSNVAKSQLLKALGYKVLADIVSLPSHCTFLSLINQVKMDAT